MFQVSRFKFQDRGITLIEVLLVIFIIALFSAILIPDFPKIKKKFALTRAVYKFAQDLKRVQDLGLSGVFYQSAQAKGYGIFVDLNNTALLNKKYILYADINGDSKYTSLVPNQLNHICGQQSAEEDCIIDTIDLSSSESGIVLKIINNVTINSQVSINFAPPNPNVLITTLVEPNTSAKIVFATESDLSETRTISVNKSGLIEVE